MHWRFRQSLVGGVNMLKINQSKLQMYAITIQLLHFTIIVGCSNPYVLNDFQTQQPMPGNVNELFRTARNYEDINRIMRQNHFRVQSINLNRTIEVHFFVNCLYLPKCLAKFSIIK